MLSRSHAAFCTGLPRPGRNSDTRIDHHHARHHLRVSPREQIEHQDRRRSGPRTPTAPAAATALMSATTSSTSCCTPCGCGTSVDRSAPSGRVLGRSYAHTCVVFATVGCTASGLGPNCAWVMMSYGEDRIGSSGGTTYVPRLGITALAGNDEYRRRAGRPGSPGIAFGRRRRRTARTDRDRPHYARTHPRARREPRAARRTIASQGDATSPTRSQGARSRSAGKFLAWQPHEPCRVRTQVAPRPRRASTRRPRTPAPPRRPGVRLITATMPTAVTIARNRL